MPHGGAASRRRQSVPLGRWHPRRGAGVITPDTPARHMARHIASCSLLIRQRGIASCSLRHRRGPDAPYLLAELATPASTAPRSPAGPIPDSRQARRARNHQASQGAGLPSPFVSRRRPLSRRCGGPSVLGDRQPTSWQHSKRRERRGQAGPGPEKQNKGVHRKSWPACTYSGYSGQNASLGFRCGHFFCAFCSGRVRRVKQRSPHTPQEGRPAA